MKEVKIDKNVPFPEKQYVHGYWAKLIAKMAVNDSIVLEDGYDAQKFRYLINRHRERVNKEFGYICRRVFEKKRWRYRIWRVK